MTKVVANRRSAVAARRRWATLWRAGAVVAAALLIVASLLDAPVGTPQRIQPSGAAAQMTTVPPRPGPESDERGVIAAPSSTTTSTTPTSSTMSVADGPSTGAPRPSVPSTVIAPLTGLPVPAWSVARNAIVSKIDAAPPAMPQVGLDQADMVLEVRIESSLSRYLAVFHSRQPPVIGPHRSARTTDLDLLSLFGHPLLAFSGANPGVVDRLAATPWKTGVGPGEVPAAWFRIEERPWPHNLFAWSEILRSRPAPFLPPPAVFSYRPVGSRSRGVRVDGFATSAGAVSFFRWDAGLGGWRRQIHSREHTSEGGVPLAPTNVVVLETRYGVSAADANSPEAVSVGGGRAWVFSAGRGIPGTWSRPDRFAPYDVRDQQGRTLGLLPGQTWVVLADGPPLVEPAG